MLKRAVEEEIGKYLAGDDRKILFIWGPRRSGKTTVLNKIAASLGERVFNFDFVSDQELFVPDEEKLGKLAREHKVILIDEVQNYPAGTVALKVLHDKYAVKIVATGSSELRRKSAGNFDSLAGRFVERHCLPLTPFEIVANSGVKEYELEALYRRIWQETTVFGEYPEVYNSTGRDEDKIEMLQNIVETYVLKDVVNIYELKDVKLAKDILTKIALQLGSEVSVREIASSLQTTPATVGNYIEIFVKNYVLVSLPAFKTNLRRAVSENRKLYFYDLGIRNALVRDFREFKLRPDAGGVWENFVVSEAEKARRNNNLKLSMYFYREYGGAEVDIVFEDYKKNYKCWEIKSGVGGGKRVFPLPHDLETVNPGNYFERLAVMSRRAGGN